MKRLKDETYAQFKERRKIEQLDEEQKLRPKMFWDSAKQGTYRKIER